LIKVSTHTLGYPEQAKRLLTVTGSATQQWEEWHAKVAYYLTLLARLKPA
jgi:hypothetical protein